MTFAASVMSASQKQRERTMNDDLCEKLWASTEWWHNDCELKRTVCDALAAKDAEIKALREQRDELLEALECYAEKVADLSRYGVIIETSLREKAEAAIAKAKGQT
jgi:hypothetical protein